MNTSTVLFCAFILVACRCCVAYDFSDREFNELLDGELLEIAEKEEIYSRTRRETDEDDERSAVVMEPEEVDDFPSVLADNVDSDSSSYHRHSCKKHNKSCCGKTSIPISLSQLNKNQTMRSASTDCYEEVNAKMGNKTLEDDLDFYNCEKALRMKKKHVCIHECAAKKLGVANEEGALDFAKVKTLLVSRVNETWQKDLLEKAVDRCSTMKYDETWKENKDDYKCNPQALQLKHCAWKQVELTCPEDHQSKARHCKKLRSKLAAEKNPL